MQTCVWPQWWLRRAPEQTEMCESHVRAGGRVYTGRQPLQLGDGQQPFGSLLRKDRVTGKSRSGRQIPKDVQGLGERKMKSRHATREIVNRLRGRVNSNLHREVVSLAVMEGMMRNTAREDNDPEKLWEGQRWGSTLLPHSSCISSHRGGGLSWLSSLCRACSQ